jgi:hypothetical protein
MRPGLWTAAPVAVVIQLVAEAAADLRVRFAVDHRVG